ncbi:MAG TPA: YicC family protein [Ignavibacteria bacterium]|nr:YicC family protein [Ignavibacteria bacterium]
MIVSMTGYGKAAGTFNDKKFSVELKSLNNRYLEIGIKCPKYLLSKEFEIKELFKDKISRGKIYVIINIDGNEGKNYFNQALISSYIDSIKKIRKEINSMEEITIEHILKFAETFSDEDVTEVEEDEFAFIKSKIIEAIDDLIEMKKNEGRQLEKDFLKRIENIETAYSKFTEISKANVNSERSKLREMINDLITDKTAINESRIEFEIALISEKLDISEECTRLKSHLKYFREFMKSQELSGRRLNFLLQEMNREVNTIASKSSDAGISQTVTIIKEELERIREQIQNVE